MKLQFLGATGTVSGSKYLLTAAGQKILVDCGLFQGLKNLRLKNWGPLPFDLEEISAIVLTHAHLDHTGLIPLLYKNGYRGKIYCTHATRDLCAILLPDSGYIQEEDARLANAQGFTKHKPALPLYTRSDAEASLQLFEALSFNQEKELTSGFTFTFQKAGHILGAASILFHQGGRTLLFSGDLGRADDPVMLPPDPIPEANFIVVESTYGDRLHNPEKPEMLLARVIRQTLARGGSILIPAFAVGRAQYLLYLIHQLKKEGQIPDVPVYLNSPMAIHATALLQHHASNHRLSSEECSALSQGVHLVRNPEESVALVDRVAKKEQAIVISASGMATGGRVLHHLKKMAPDPRHTLVFAGFQAAGTRGEALVHGASTIKIHGEVVEVRAQVVSFDNMSAHADYQGIIQWLSGLKSQPRKVFITHGEPLASEALRKHMKESLGWDGEVPEYRDEALLI